MIWIDSVSVSIHFIFKNFFPFKRLGESFLGEIFNDWIWWFVKVGRTREEMNPVEREVKEMKCESGGGEIGKKEKKKKRKRKKKDNHLEQVL